MNYSICEYPDGQRYEGMWKAGKKDGRGSLKYKNGASYDGRFRDDQFDGQGAFVLTRPVEDLEPGDWLIPLDIQIDIGRVHLKAGFNKEGV